MELSLNGFAWSILWNWNLNSKMTLMIFLPTCMLVCVSEIVHIILQILLQIYLYRHNTMNSKYAFNFTFVILQLFYHHLLYYWSRILKRITAPYLLKAPQLTAECAYEGPCSEQGACHTGTSQGAVEQAGGEQPWRVVANHKSPFFSLRTISTTSQFVFCSIMLCNRLIRQ